MPDSLDPQVLLALGAVGCTLGLAVLAAALIARAAEERDLAGRMRAVVRPAEGDVAEARLRASLGATLLRPILHLGEILRGTAIVAEKDVAEFQRAVAAAGFEARTAVSVFIGVKAVMLAVLPLLAFVGVSLLDMGPMRAVLIIFGTLVLAVFGPNWFLGRMRRPFQKRLRKGLPDALDLMVVAAEAGLGLESALDRVAREMAGSNPAIALELNILVQELRMMPDRRLVLERLGERTGLEGFKRLGSTLSQTIRYGTPLAQALRVLAAEMRQERMMRIEEKTIRLPALLVGPLIFFILPALFIALIGPSVLEIAKVMSPK
ncbi:type II secretion system F family protein [Siccirubricoccus sp. KC 17139]|uniref:Type II secretion system F family protein n=1 Tax=Siccirubricoccus soli TaxID=2899147 RepID=A0ABT1DBB5_9PROT|nr:type II secretion system F family protein [Siccirubricoccus soli]MCO6419226.1 type II secretion system F family protein [Siccirubricoccus soli]MCP2685361.1 type II secretion system F family protein [Siccirubricoccus soli]